MSVVLARQKININHVYKDNFETMRDLYAACDFLKAYLKESSEHIYICIYSGYNHEIKWLRTEFTDDEIFLNAMKFMTDNL